MAVSIDAVVDTQSQALTSSFEAYRQFFHGQPERWQRFVAAFRKPEVLRLLEEAMELQIQALEIAGLTIEEVTMLGGGQVPHQEL